MVPEQFLSMVPEESLPMVPEQSLAMVPSDRSQWCPSNRSQWCPSNPSQRCRNHGRGFFVHLTYLRTGRGLLGQYSVATSSMTSDGNGG
jgi:hypothetical protein